MIRRKLRMLDAADELTDLRVPPGNRLERLEGDPGEVLLEEFLEPTGLSHTARLAFSTWKPSWG